ncbi:MAG: DUF6323 family protein [Syntrophomonas sp.]
MNFVDIYKSMEGTLEKLTIGEVLKTNEESKKYGLVLTAEEANVIIETRNLAIKNYGRVELGIEVVKKIIAAFCTSPYINSQDYASTLNELIEIFYYMKNETEDRIGDDELIGIMKEYFNNSCSGSAELLRNRELPLFAINFRQQLNQVIDFSLKEEQL